jgi:CheY-like chemotaxis protein
VHFATSGEAALQRLAEGIEPTLIVILSDINMPGIDGLDLLREVKAAVSRSLSHDGDRLSRRRAAKARFLSDLLDDAFCFSAARLW